MPDPFRPPRPRNLNNHLKHRYPLPPDPLPPEERRLMEALGVPPELLPPSSSPSSSGRRSSSPSSSPRWSRWWRRLRRWLQRQEVRLGGWLLARLAHRRSEVASLQLLVLALLSLLLLQTVLLVVTASR